MRILHLLAMSAAMTVALCAAAQEPKQIYQMTPAEAAGLISGIHESQPDLRKRIAAIARRNIGQPYKLNLLGEYPYQLHDTLPMFSLEQSDCTVFVEHTYAMALSESWEEFFWMLQRIRYKDGVVGVATRNHYTEVDWNINNRWLLTDVSATLPGAAYYGLTVDRANFLQTRHGTRSSIPVQHSREAYVPLEHAAQAFQQMNEGDMVNVISIRNGQHMVTHVGLVVQDAQGQRRLLHSSEPAVREEPFEAFVARTQARRGGLQLAGIKFLRLNDAIAVPPAAPQPRPQRRQEAAP